MLKNELTATTAGSNRLAIPVHRNHRHEATATGAHHLRNHSAFSAQCDAVTGVLHIAARIGVSIGCQSSGPNGEATVGAVGLFHRRNCKILKIFPIDVHDSVPLSSSRSLRVGNVLSCRRTGLPDESGDRNDGHDVGNHRDQV